MSERGAHGSHDLRVWGTNPALQLSGPNCAGRIDVTSKPTNVQIRFDTRRPRTCHFSAPGSGTIVGTHFVGVHAQILCVDQAPCTCRTCPGPEPAVTGLELATRR